MVQEFHDAIVGLELQWTAARIGRMEARYAELGLDERKELVLLQQHKQKLKESLQGEES
jgi:hypothetical protein